MGICHQVNLERVSRVVQVRELDGRRVAIPDTLVGTDSHTTMVNGLGCWAGAWAASRPRPPSGQAMYLPTPVWSCSVGRRLRRGHRHRPGPELTEMLRHHGVVNSLSSSAATA